jgi:hypothetical protein
MNSQPATDPADLELRWQALGTPSGERLAAERVTDWAGGPVLVALDSEGTRHLLVRVDPTRDLRLPRAVAGLGITVRQLHPPGQPDASWVDLASGEPAWHRPFCGLSADVITELPPAGPPDPAAMFAVLERWRRFCDTSHDGLTRDEQVGLVGELWLLLEWLPRLIVASVTAWQGPLRGRHDFVTPTTSVEVKTTRAATGPVVHRIARLDQLDEPGAGQLYVLSLRAVPDPLGGASLDNLLRRTRAAASAVGGTCTALLEARLSALDVTGADDGRYTEPLRISQQELYRVDTDFPRLIPSSFPTGLPGGVVDVAYSLDTSACQQWLASSNPEKSPLSALL